MLNLLLALVLIVADQGFKWLAVNSLKGQPAITVIPHLLGLRYAENTGAAFSILSGEVDFLILFTGAALIAIAYAIITKKIGDKMEVFCFVLIFAGGVGNLIDRIVNGVVVDYLEFLFIDFPIFNFADVLICCGVGLYAVYIIYSEIICKNKKDKTDEQ